VVDLFDMQDDIVARLANMLSPPPKLAARNGL
jgi:hypothetical protein